MKMMKRLSFFLFAFLLYKVSGPGSVAYLGVAGNTVNTIQEARQFASIGEAYSMQKTLGNEWSIGGEGANSVGKIG